MAGLPKRASGEVRSLPALCTEAADHVAHARLLLDDERYDADHALKSLDDAIACLQRLRATGRVPHTAIPDRRSA